MTLEDFERELASEKRHKHQHEHRRRDKRDADRSDRHHHRHKHRHSSRQHDSQDDEEHRRKRRRQSPDESKSHDSHARRRHRNERDSTDHSNPPDSPLDTAEQPNVPLKRDSWMEAPSSLEVDYISKQPRKETPPATQQLEANYELKLHEKELNHHLHDVQQDESPIDPVQESAHEVNYTFGDSGSRWRMTKLRAVYRQAEQSGRNMDEIALERYSDLREFDDAREEEIELGRRDTYGKDYVGKEKPSGDLYEERKLDTGIRRGNLQAFDRDNDADLPQAKAIETEPPRNTTQPLDQTALNRLKARLMKAQVRGGAEAEKLQAEYDAALASFANHKQPDVVVLGAMDNRMLSSAPRNEVKAVETRRGRERGQVQENEDMTIEDMVREERRTRGQTGGDGQRFAERIAKDGKFENDLEYMDDNAMKLARRVQKSEINIRNMAINDFQKINRILDTCPLCHHEDTSTPPVAPMVSLATRIYLTLPTEPELTDGATCIVPIQHRTNLLECDDDEWEEIRNFMKSLTRLYHDQGRDVIFYENAAQPQRRKHAAMQVVPLPYSLGETAPAFFKEAILSADEEWTQHKKVFDTLSKSKQGLGKMAFRRSLAKEMPYFHVWFELDGGLGHVVEDTLRWPKGDLFAREIIGGMLDLPPDVIKKQGRWHKGHDRRVDDFQKRWRKFDWTRVLTEGM
ncbi:MAG: hypothetical protein Q9160_000864 [Pyrenula sp. 1 TL-2023]